MNENPFYLCPDSLAPPNMCPNFTLYDTPVQVNYRRQLTTMPTTRTGITVCTEHKTPPIISETLEEYHRLIAARFPQERVAGTNPFVDITFETDPLAGTDIPFDEEPDDDEDDEEPFDAAGQDWYGHILALYNTGHREDITDVVQTHDHARELLFDTGHNEDYAHDLINEMEEEGTDWATLGFNELLGRYWAYSHNQPYAIPLAGTDQYLQMNATGQYVQVRAAPRTIANL